MTPHDPRFSDGDDPSSEPLASDHVQREIAAMLRHAARDESGPEAHMPADVEARIRDALRSETLGAAGSTPVSASSTPSTVVPLPVARRRPSSDADETRSAPLPRTDARPSRQPVEEPDDTVGQPMPASSTVEDAPVRSLDEHRKRRKGLGRSALALGAAAAVVIGGLGVWKGMSGSGSPASSADASPQVRVTNTGTPYTHGGLATQAASLVSSTAKPITSTDQAEQARLGGGNLTTKEGVEQCVNAIASSLTGTPDKIYADFGTFDKRKAVIVMVEKNGSKQVWAVNRTCTKKSDKLAGPDTVST